MSEAKPTSTEPETPSLANLKLDSTPAPKANGTNPGASAFTPSAKFDWAEDASSPIAASDKKAGGDKSEVKSDLKNAQTDGATTWLQGSYGLNEPEFDVNVKLADLQANQDNPLYSVKSFEELNL